MKAPQQSHKILALLYRKLQSCVFAVLTSFEGLKTVTYYDKQVGWRQSSLLYHSPTQGNGKACFGHHKREDSKTCQVLLNRQIELVLVLGQTTNADNGVVREVDLDDWQKSFVGHIFRSILCVCLNMHKVRIAQRGL